MIVGITGATGFIGKRLALKHVERGNTVRILTRRDTKNAKNVSGMEWYDGDLCRPESLTLFVKGIDILFHCAAELKNPAKMVSTNIDGTRNLIDAAAGRIERWVQLSSVGVYGKHRYGIIDEDTHINPEGLYEETKAESDRLVIEASQEDKIMFSMLRPSIVFGPNMPNQSLFQMIKMIDNGLFFFIGKPGASANYIHVDNVVEGLLLCGTQDDAKNRIFNLSDHRTMEAFSAAIAEFLGKPAAKRRWPEALVRGGVRILEKVPGFPLTESRVDALTGRAVYPTKRIENELGYSPCVTMEDGLKQLVQAYKNEK